MYGLGYLFIALKISTGAPTNTLGSHVLNLSTERSQNDAFAFKSASVDSKVHDGIHREYWVQIGYWYYCLCITCGRVLVCGQMDATGLCCVETVLFPCALLYCMVITVGLLLEQRCTYVSGNRTYRFWCLFYSIFQETAYCNNVTVRNIVCRAIFTPPDEHHCATWHDMSIPISKRTWNS